MNKKRRALVCRRADHRCEYCCLPETDAPVTHIIARKHGGPTQASNLAAACHHCNFHKQTDLAGIDSRTGRHTLLFNPRRHKWKRHFRWKGVILLGRTAVGRTTVAVLAMNHDDMVDLRERLQAEGRFPW